MNFFKKKKPEAPGETFDAAVDKAYKKNKARMDAKESRQRKIEDCIAVLQDCRFTFNKTIAVENSLAAEMRSKGYLTNKQHDRVRDCAIGILVVDQALYEIKSINTEDDMNSAFNKMGMALRQLRRIDNSSAAVSTSTEKIIRQWYPGGLTTGELTDEKEAEALPQVPEELIAIVDENFVQNMMAGHSFEMCMRMRQQVTREDPTRENREKLRERVRAALGNTESDDAEDNDFIEMYKSKL